MPSYFLCVKGLIFVENSMTTEFILQLVMSLIPGILVLIAAYMVMNNMSKNLHQTLRTEIIRQNNKDFAKLKLGAYERLALLLERNSIPNLIHKFSNSAGKPSDILKMMTHAINEEFNYNVSQQVYVSAQTWGTIKIVKEQTLMVLKKVHHGLPENAAKSDYFGALIKELKESGDIPHEKGLQMIRGEMELLFN